MAARITLTRYGILNADFEYLSGHRIRVEAEATLGESEGEDGDEPETGTMTDKIFVWARGPVHGTSGNQDEWYERPANLADLVNYPEDEPDLLSDYPVFRRNYFEIDVATWADVQAVWDNIRERVQALCDAFNLYSDLQVVETEDFS